MGTELGSCSATTRRASSATRSASVVMEVTLTTAAGSGSCGRRSRQDDFDGEAPVGSGGRLDRALMRLHDRRGDGEPQPGSRGPGVAGEPPERLEEGRQVLVADGLAIVRNTEEHLRIRQRSGGDDHPWRVVAAVLHGVLDEIVREP